MTHDPEITREILNAFWKIHILYHAAKEPISGNWMLKELREHGYEISPGTLYPLLKRMSERNWLKDVSQERQSPKDARLYRITDRGLEVLDVVCQQLNELKSEVLPKSQD